MTTTYAAPGALALVLALAGCGHSDRVDPVGPAPSVSVTVRTTIDPGPHGELFTEGAVPQVRLVGPGGTLSPDQDDTDSSVFRDVLPGRYRLEAALRPCDGNCGTLDGPTHRCSQQVRVREDSSFVVTWRGAGSPCRVAPA